MLFLRLLLVAGSGLLVAACGDSRKNSTGSGGVGGAGAGIGGTGGSAGSSVATSGAGATSGGTGGIASGGTTGGAGRAGMGGSSGTGGPGATGGTASGGSENTAGTSAGGGEAGADNASGAGGEGGAASPGEGVEGIYNLDDVTQSDVCEPGGASIRSFYQATHLVAARTTIPSTGGDRPAVVVAGCSGLAACRSLGEALVDDWTASELLPNYLFLTEESDGTFTNTTVFYGTLDGDTCRDGGIDLLTLSLAGRALEIEIRTQRTDYPAVNGTCPLGAASAAGASAACNLLRIITGTRVQEI